MKKTLPLVILALITLAGVKQTNAQFTFSDVQYWIGSGSDTSLLVVDFHDGSFWDTCYAWGYLHNGSATGADMLNAVAAADINFSVSTGGGILHDIVYGAHSGIGGTGGLFWSTWSGTNIANMTMNAGISTPLSNGEWFACSFTDFNPAVAPGEPIPAFDPLYFVAQDVTFWVGTGTDTTMLVIDFLSGSGVTSYAWGYLHSGNTTGEEMLMAIAAADPDLTVTIGAVILYDITYGSLAGIGGSPNYWSTWSATNLGNWNMNTGISTPIGNGDVFGCSYTDFAPALRPGYPVAAPNTIGLSDPDQQPLLSVYPNPATDYLHVNLSRGTAHTATVSIVDATGKQVYHLEANSNDMQIPVHQLPDGYYSIHVTCGNSVCHKHFVKQ